MFQFSDAVVPNVIRTINVPGGSFDVCLEPPSADERLTDEGILYEMVKANGARHAAAYRDQFMRRCRRIVDWIGITGTDGKPIPFSHEMLQRVMSKHPSVVEQLKDILAPLYFTDEAALGEPAAPWGASQPAAQVTPSSANTSTEPPSQT
ncbi:hypothetical protein [Schlesneria paludicola]|uniref:hypothetical protein n=1 Tax=Schlesneria paludicola TaxID=360056 RepID=UPI00029A24D6|nr:hypothetical protein [Schlesneria paludicola]